MNNLSLAINKINTRAILFLFFMVTLVALAPLLNQQIITGTIVNAILFITTITLGIRSGFVVAVIPSMIAFSVGLLPLFFMIPFIVISNVLLVFFFNLFRSKNYWLAATISILLKSAFLLIVTLIIGKFIVQQEMLSKVILMMSWPQIITALSGAVLAFFILKIKDNSINRYL